jgi:hypothetical protein
MKQRKRMIIGMTILFAMAWSFPVSAQEKRLESSVESNIVTVITGLLKRLPQIWKTKREARKLVAGLPSYQGQIQTPDSATIYAWIKDLCRNPDRRPGTDNGHQAEAWVAEQFKAMGLEQVTMDPVSMTVWTAKQWSLNVDGKKIPSFFVVNTGFTGPDGVSAPLVYVGTGREKDFETVDVKGKIVVAEVPFPKMPYGILLKGSGAAYAISDPDHEMKLSSSQYLNFVRQNFIGGTDEKNAPKNDVYWNAYKKGAIAICLILRDQPSNSNTHYGPYDGVMKPMPGLWIGKYDGAALRESAKAGAKATLVLTGTKEPGVMHNVWGVLPGKSDDVILVTSHHDSPFTGAIEDGAGTAQVLAQAWTWSRVPKDQRPKTLVFVLDSGHFYGSLGGHTFARDHQEIMKRVKILITLEHLGGKDVVEKNGEYAETGKLAFTVMFSSKDPKIIASEMKAFAEKPAKMTASIPFDFFGPAPTSDAAGYVLESGVPVISWIGCPYYLLDSHDTLDKVDQPELKPIADTVAALVGIHMMMR